MSDAPQRGEMILYDYIQPALTDGSYRLVVSTDVSGHSAPGEMQDTRYFDIIGPRFSIAPTDVAGVYPPRNGHGDFSDSLPMLVLYRRTLPWERDPRLTATPLSPRPNQAPDLTGPVPWVALLLFEEGDDYAFLPNISLDQAVPPAVFDRLGQPQNITCDAVEVELALLSSILPTVEELRLLAHARRVNVDDRELSAGSSNGWFSVVISNRLPAPEAKCRACLVSLEQRDDIVFADAPQAQPGAPLTSVSATTAASTTFSPGVIDAPALERSGDAILARLRTRLVVLHSWQFTCAGTATFGELMQNLDTGMIGKLAVPGKPAISDTGHIRVSVQNRAGVQEIAWYRGPLVPLPLTRDPLGPYHSADQARRVTPDTGAEDISYAAAFEVGRLLAAADARLAQELMRWRRSGYAASLRLAVITRLREVLPFALPPHLEDQVVSSLIPTIAASALARVAQGIRAVADPYNIGIVSRAVGLNPTALAAAWHIDTGAAAVLLGGDPGALGAAVTAPSSPAPGIATIDSIAADIAAQQRLIAAREQFIQNLGLRQE